MKRCVEVVIQCAILVLHVCAVEGSSVRMVTRSGASAPGGSTFSVGSDGFNAPLLNELGQTAFLGTAGDIGIWSEGNGPLALVAKVGQPAPGVSGATFSTFSIVIIPSMVLNDNGNLAFTGVVTGPGITSGSSSNSRGIWESDSGGVSLLFRERDTVVASTNEKLSFDRFEGLAFNNSNVAAFGASTRFEFSSTVQDVYLTGSLTDSRIVARGGTTPPGLSSQNFFGSLNTVDFKVKPLNDHSQASLEAHASGTSLCGAPAGTCGVWTENATGLQLVATRQAAPGFPGREFLFFYKPSINNAAHTVFAASAVIPGDFPTSQGGIWSDRTGTLQLVVGKGDSVPGVVGASFDDFGLSTDRQVPLINHLDRVVFAAKMAGAVNGSNDSAIFSDGPGGLSIVAREGDQVPGAPTGTVFSDLYECHLSSSFRSCGYSINGNGQVAFLDPSRGLFAQDINGVLQAIARNGGTLEIAPGDFRQISGVQFWGGSGNEDGRSSAFNDKGQIAFKASFGNGATSGGTGIFVSDVVAIPEPQSNVLLAIGLFSVCAPRIRTSPLVG
jgi:hypothetical protein